MRFTGQRVNLTSEPWLGGPIAPVTGVGRDYFASLADSEGLRLRQSDHATGVIAEFGTLRGNGFRPHNVHPRVIRFYEETSAYELVAWAEWCGLFRSFGWLLAVLFSRGNRASTSPSMGILMVCMRAMCERSGRASTFSPPRMGWCAPTRS